MCVFPNLDTENFARVKPTVNDLAGKYLPTKQTLQSITNEGHYKVNKLFVSLRSDGSFEMQNMPDWWLTDFGEPQGCLVNGQGSWEVVQQQSWWELRLDFLSGENLCLENYSTGLTISVPIVGNTAPYSLWFYVGDPDSGKVMIFEKRK